MGERRFIFPNNAYAGVVLVSACREDLMGAFDASFRVNIGVVGRF